MAKPLPQHLWKKGQSGNPRGPKKYRKDLKDIKVIGQRNAAKLIQKIMDMDRQELENMFRDPDTPMWELMVGRVIDKALQDGDTTRLNFLFDRTIGKVVEKRELEITPVTYKTTVRGDGALIQEIIEEEKQRDYEYSVNQSETVDR